jgi:hypothetical protein
MMEYLFFATLFLFIYRKTGSKQCCKSTSDVFPRLYRRFIQQVGDAHGLQGCNTAYSRDRHCTSALARNVTVPLSSFQSPRHFHLLCLLFVVAGPSPTVVALGLLLFYLILKKT